MSWVQSGWVSTTPEWVDPGVVVAQATGSGVGAGLSWVAESSVAWQAELNRRARLHMPTVAELEARIAAHVRRRREEEWLLDLTPQETDA